MTSRIDATHRHHIINEPIYIRRPLSRQVHDPKFESGTQSHLDPTTIWCSTTAGSAHLQRPVPSWSLRLQPTKLQSSFGVAETSAMQRPSCLKSPATSGPKQRRAEKAIQSDASAIFIHLYLLCRPHHKDQPRTISVVTDHPSSKYQQAKIQKPNCFTVYLFSDFRRG